MAGFLKVLPTILKATVEFKNDKLSSLNFKFNPTIKYSLISMRPIYNFDSWAIISYTKSLVNATFGSGKKSC